MTSSESNTEPQQAAEVANQKAAILQAGGVRDAAVLTTAGQRRINLIWEVTQAIIAVLVTVGTLVISGWLVLKSSESSATAFLLLSNAFFMIVTAYFQRTNHTKTGGITEKGER